MQIYVGTQAENKRYQQLRKANNLAEEKSYSEAMGDWGRGNLLVTDQVPGSGEPTAEQVRCLEPRRI
jgi:hypothetical protein